jgi:hypothetical protein
LITKSLPTELAHSVLFGCGKLDTPPFFVVSGVISSWELDYEKRKTASLVSRRSTNAEDARSEENPRG